jgi:hypothetical protein
MVAIRRERMIPSVNVQRYVGIAEFISPSHQDLARKLASSLVSVTLRILTSGSFPADSTS